MDSVVATADGVSTVGIVTTTLEGAAGFSALGALALAAFSTTGVAATTGAGAVTGADFLAILFDLTEAEEEDISNALVYSYLRRSCKSLSF